MSSYDLGTGLLGTAGGGSSGGGSTSYMKNIFGSRYRGYGTTDIGDQGTTSGGIPSLRGGVLGRSESVAQMYLAVTQVTNERDKIYRAIMEIEDYAIVQSILEIMHDDVLSPDEATNEVFSIGSDNEKYDSMLKGMEKRLELDDMVSDMTSDFLLFGEYPYKIFTRENKGGIAALEELLVPTDITPIFKGRSIVRYLVRSQGTSVVYSQTSYESLSPYDFVSFLRYPRKVRLNANMRFQFLVDGVAKVGRSIFPLETLEKIKSLYLLEKMLPLARIIQLNRSTIVGIQLGASMMTKAVIEACREYERYLNSSSENYYNTFDIQNIISQVGKFKVIPILGENKGQIIAQPGADPHDTTDRTIADIMDLRNSIVSSVGMLPSYFSGAVADKGFTESLKAYVRYLRKLDSIQKNITQGLNHLAMVELHSLGMDDAVPSDVKVVFANNVSLANIERLEFLDILVALLQNYHNFIDSLAQDPATNDYIDKVEMLSFIKKKLTYLKGAEGAINLNEEPPLGKEDVGEDTREIDEILENLPKDVRREISNNIIKIKKEIPPPKRQVDAI